MWKWVWIQIYRCRELRLSTASNFPFELNIINDRGFNLFGKKTPINHDIQVSSYSPLILYLLRCPFHPCPWLVLDHHHSMVVVYLKFRERKKKTIKFSRIFKEFGCTTATFQIVNNSYDGKIIFTFYRCSEQFGFVNVVIVFEQFSLFRFLW